MTSIYEVYGTEETHEELLERGIDITITIMDRYTCKVVLNKVEEVFSPSYEMKRRLKALYETIDSADVEELSQAVAEYVRLMTELDKELD